jgi:hypothetical protein
MLESLEEGRLCFSRIDRVESDLIYEENIKYRGKETGCGEEADGCQKQFITEVTMSLLCLSGAMRL